MHALFVDFNWGNFLRNFWEVCTFRLVRIFTPEDMFASAKEIGKGCNAVHSISDFFCLISSLTKSTISLEGNLPLFALDRLH